MVLESYIIRLNPARDKPKCHMVAYNRLVITHYIPIIFSLYPKYVCISTVLYIYVYIFLYDTPPRYNVLQPHYIHSISQRHIPTSISVAVRCSEDNFIFRQRLVDNTWASRPPKIEHERLPPLGATGRGCGGPGPRHVFFWIFSDLVKFGDSNFFTLVVKKGFTVVVKPVSETVSADIPSE